ncbi:MAG: response regulator transcription factor [Lachnospiraceae bacterium]|nr:response regulator transcription factor [Lachnospiraceae bacterium]
MRIAVCDDEALFLEQAISLLKKLCPQYFDDIGIDGYTDNVKMLLQHEKEPYDIVVMDIQMSPLDGFAAAERLSQMEHECKLIFFSSKEELVFQSFHYEPVYFVRKGSEERIAAELARALKRIQEKYYKRVCLYFPDKSGMVKRVPVAELEYVESSRNYLMYHTVSGGEGRLRKTMEEEEQNLGSYGFLRIHRAFLVNREYVVQMKPNASEIRMKSGKVLEVGKHYRQTVMEYFMENKR